MVEIPTLELAVFITANNLQPRLEELEKLVFKHKGAYYIHPETARVTGCHSFYVYVKLPPDAPEEKKKLIMHSQNKYHKIDHEWRLKQEPTAQGSTSYHFTHIGVVCP